MKKIILLIFLFSFISNAQTVITFEDDSFISSADLTVGSEADEVSIVVDPTDASNKVLKFVVGDGPFANWWDAWNNSAGVTLPSLSNSAIASSVSFDIWTDQPPTSEMVTQGKFYGYMLKLEAPGNDNNVEKGFPTSGTGWENITVDLSNCDNNNGGNCNRIPDKTGDEFNRIAFIHWGGGDPSAPYVTDDQPLTIYIDNITYENGAVIPAPADPISEFTVDFETASGFSAAAGAISFAEANGYGTASLTNNDWWSNIQKTFDNPFDLSTQDRAFSMKIRGSRNSSITLKLENSSDGNSNHEWRDDNTFEYDTPGQWKTIVFNASSLSNTDFDRVVIFFDIQTDRPADESSDTFDIDDVKFGSYAVLSSRNFEKLKDVSLYPNPSKDFININSFDKVDGYSIYDLTGQVVKNSNPNSNNFRIDVTSLSKGVYLVKLNSGGKTSSVKLIKEN